MKSRESNSHGHFGVFTSKYIIFRNVLHWLRLNRIKVVLYFIMADLIYRSTREAHHDVAGQRTAQVYPDITGQQELLSDAAACCFGHMKRTAGAVATWIMLCKDYMYANLLCNV